MKSKILLAPLLVIFLVPIAFGLSTGDSTGANATGTPDGKTDCEPDVPTIYLDPTARAWEPNDETWYTWSAYGTFDLNKHGYPKFDNPKRGNYVFTGEVMRYFVIVENDNGPLDVDYVALMVDDEYGGLCVKVDDFADVSSFGPNFPTSGYNSATMASFVCKLIVDGQDNVLYDISIEAATGGENGICMGSETNSINIEQLLFNPPFSISVNGEVDFGLVIPGSVAGSMDSIVLENTGEVVLDTYIAASDYFSDPSNPLAICGDGNGIPYWAFSYYAMKGTVNSGMNDNSAYGLGETIDDPNIDTIICNADVDEYTQLPSNSGRIDDMCRIINWDEDASLLNGGDTMSLLFQLDVPTPCVGSFSNGQIFFVGEVV